VKRALLTAALVAFPASAFGQADLSTVDRATVIASITPVQVVLLLESRGYTATAVGLDTDTPYVETTANGINYSFNLYACTGAKVKACEQVQIRAWFEREGGDPQTLMATYNRDWVFGKAYLSDDGKMVIEHALTMQGGITVANFVNTIDLWEAMLGDFTNTIGW
jgi:hypothetical protein